MPIKTESWAPDREETGLLNHQLLVTRYSKWKPDFATPWGESTILIFYRNGSTAGLVDQWDTGVAVRELLQDVKLYVTHYNLDTAEKEEEEVTLLGTGGSGDNGSNAELPELGPFTVNTIPGKKKMVSVFVRFEDHLINKKILNRLEGATIRTKKKPRGNTKRK